MNISYMILHKYSFCKVFITNLAQKQKQTLHYDKSYILDSNGPKKMLTLPPCSNAPVFNKLPCYNNGDREYHNIAQSFAETEDTKCARGSQQKF